jgi:putative drug exporter of the RND superfamily
MVVAMGLALGIDYSLFIVARLREDRARGAPIQEAIMAVAGSATRAVVFSGTSFVLAMSAMLLVPDTTLRSLGLGAAIVGLVSIAVALTFQPALLMVLGDRVERGRIPFVKQREESRFWLRAVSAVMKRPALSLVSAVVIMLALATPVLGLQMGTAGAGGPRASTFSSTARETPRSMAGIDRLRGELARDRDFAAAALITRPAGDALVASVPLTVEPSSERGSRSLCSAASTSSGRGRGTRRTRSSTASPPPPA